MSVDLGAISGVLELKDEWTSTINFAEASLSKFSEQTQESFKAIGEAGALVAATFVAIGAAVVELGKRGAEVTNVENTLEHFAGGAKQADDIMQRLHATTLGTVDDFLLAKDAAHLLSAGVKLTADDFSTLGSAAELLKKRGLGETADTLKLVSDAMVTGRTRALSMALGVVDVKDAEDQYAKSLGVTKNELSLAGLAEAKRIAIMGLLRTAVADAGVQERDFGEQIKAGETAIINWVDDLGQAVAKSPALAAGMKAIGDAVNQAFGGDNTDSIKMIMEWIKSATVMAINFGIGMVEVARVVNVAWSAIQVVVLGTETAIVGLAAAVAGTIAMVLSAAASLPGATQGMKDMAAAAAGVAREGGAMTKSLADETAEAAKGLVGHSAFDKTLDHLSGTLMEVKDAVNGAAASVDKSNETTNIAANNAKKLAEAQKSITAGMIDRQKVEDAMWKIEKKSLEETTVLWTEFYNLRAKQSGTTLDGQKADIKKWFDDEVSKLDDSDVNWRNHYNALKAVADQKLKGIESDWDQVKDKSIEALQETYEKAINTYNDMTSGSLHFSREALSEQIDKIHAAADAMRGMGQDGVAAENAVADAALKAADAIKKQEEAAKAAAAANRALGGSMTYDLSTQEGMDYFKKLNPGATINAGLDYFKNHSLQDAIQAGLVNLYGKYTTNPNPTHFAEGGTVMVGERGPEVVRLPFGSQVYPTGTGPSGSSIVNNFYVNGTAADVARQVSDKIMQSLKLAHKFGAA